VATELAAQMEDRVTGEMTGADRALVSSLEGFEDLQLVGDLQLRTTASSAATWWCA
jgi:N-acetylmuramic acid 6-phosphate etherase